MMHCSLQQTKIEELTALQGFCLEPPKASPSGNKICAKDSRLRGLILTHRRPDFKVSLRGYRVEGCIRLIGELFYLGC